MTACGIGRIRVQGINNRLHFINLPHHAAELFTANAPALCEPTCTADRCKYRKGHSPSLSSAPHHRPAPGIDLNQMTLQNQQSLRTELRLTFRSPATLSSIRSPGLRSRTTMRCPRCWVTVRIGFPVPEILHRQLAWYIQAQEFIQAWQPHLCPTFRLRRRTGNPLPDFTTRQEYLPVYGIDFNRRHLLSFIGFLSYGIFLLVGTANHFVTVKSVRL